MTQVPARVSDINSLSPTFRKKFDLWRTEVKAKYPNAGIFEARRSVDRQKYYYAQGRYKPYQNNKVITWTMQSKHLTWDAVDVIFYDAKWNPTWNWPYDDLIQMWLKYGIHNLKPRETCHFEDDGTELKLKPTLTEKQIDLCKKAMIWNSALYDQMNGYTELQKNLNEANNSIRELGVKL